MLIKNENLQQITYPQALKSILNIEAARSSRQLLYHWQKINAYTPVWSLPQLAKDVGVAQITLKDESKRSELSSFKALGAPNALVRLILRHFPEMNSTAILTGKYRGKLQDFTVISATDGNHGRSLAAACQDAGCACVIILHAEVSIEREKAIADYGAKIVRISGNYDKSVDEAQRLASQNHWQVVSDTSYNGYELIPGDVMQGYGVMAAEIIEQLQENQLPPVTHVILQGGVGGLAAGVISYLWEYYQVVHPQFIVVEPKQADCLYQSAINGIASKATGVVDSVMAGLACGETSPLAWQFLKSSVAGFLLIEDSEAEKAMQRLAAGSATDIPIVSGESGAAGVAGLLSLTENEKTQLNMDDRSHILLINTEGATAPTIFQHIVGKNETTVLTAQKEWLKNN